MSFNFAALNAIANGIPSLVSSQSTIGKFIQQINCSAKTKALVDLTGNTDNDKDIWIDTIRKEILDGKANPRYWAKEIRKDIKKSLQAWRNSILVLLHKFNEAQESCLGYQLCRKLVNEGRHLLVSTTASGDELKSEIQKAKWLTDQSAGSITLLEPQYGEKEEPCVEWIEHPRSKHFWHLSQLQNIQMIIGILPGTSQTAVALKNELNCKLILLATTKIGSSNDILKDEICKLAMSADEIWSVGSDTYSHYNNIFTEIISPEQHKQILFQPLTSGIPRGEQNAEVHNISRRIVSTWNSKVQFYLNRKKMYSKGSEMKSFLTLSSALRNVMQSETMTEQLQWGIHGFKTVYPTLRSAENLSQSTTLSVQPLDGVTSADHVDWENCRAFIVPDYEEETFNYFALTAIWLGIPTLASSQSSIGKFLMSLSCPETSRCLVNLTGDSQCDIAEWTNKITEVLNLGVRHTPFCRELTMYIRRHTGLWELNLPTLNRKCRRWLSPSLNASLFVKYNGQIIMSEVLDEVAKELEKRADDHGNTVTSFRSGTEEQSSTGSQVSYVLI